MKQADIYKATNISRSSISRILSGDRAPSWEMAKKLEKATGVKILYWMESISNPSALSKQLALKGLSNDNKSE